MRSFLAAAAVVLAVAGCSSGTHQTAKAVTHPTTPSASPAGPQGFIAAAQTMTFGSTDLRGATDDQILNLGNTVCDGLGSGLGFGRVVQGLVESNAHPTSDEADGFARDAVRNLCPDLAGDVPS